MAQFETGLRPDQNQFRTANLTSSCFNMEMTPLNMPFAPGIGSPPSAPRKAKRDVVQGEELCLFWTIAPWLEQGSDMRLRTTREEQKKIGCCASSRKCVRVL